GALVAHVEADDLHAPVLAGVLGHRSPSTSRHPNPPGAQKAKCCSGVVPCAAGKVSSGGPNRTGWSSGSTGQAGNAGRNGFFRAHPRFDTRLRVLVTHVQAGWQRHAPVENMGLGGARLLVDERLAVGEWVTLSFTAPTLWDPLVLRARIAWVAPG